MKMYFSRRDAKMPKNNILLNKYNKLSSLKIIFFKIISLKLKPHLIEI